MSEIIWFSALSDLLHIAIASKLSNLQSFLVFGFLFLNFQSTTVSLSERSIEGKFALIPWNNSFCLSYSFSANAVPHSFVYLFVCLGHHCVGVCCCLLILQVGKHHVVTGCLSESGPIFTYHLQKFSTFLDLIMACSLFQHTLT